MNLPEPHDTLTTTDKLNRVYSMTEKHHNKVRPLEGKIHNLASLYKLDIDNFYMKITFMGQKRMNIERRLRFWRHHLVVALPED